MWQQYRRTLVPTQLFIAAACGALLYGGVPLLGVAVVFIVMQAGSLLGAIWAARLKRRLEGNDQILPLQRRR